MTKKNPAAVALGRKGGKSKSPAKVAAGKINAAKATAARLVKRQAATPSTTLLNSSKKLGKE